LKVLHKENLLFFQSSPPPFCPDGRTIDSDAIVDVIDKADKFVYIAVMDYFPTTQFSRPRK
jgi:phospholipase D3/4